MAVRIQVLPGHVLKMPCGTEVHIFNVETGRYKSMWIVKKGNRKVLSDENGMTIEIVERESCHYEIDIDN